MRNLFVFLIVSSIFSLTSCEKENETPINDELITETTVNIEEYEIFGEPFEINDLMSNDEMRQFYENMEVGDSVQISFKSKVNSICQKKGCWMTLDLGDESSESFVKFKDYEFFVPMDAADSDAVIKGMAYKGETTVQELRHYAEDAGKTQEEIDAITEPKIEYTFIADGVYLKKNESES